MKNLKHTPGPWQINSALSIHGQRGHFVAQAGNEADASLIAAAPDMLAALTAVKAFHRHQGIDVFPVSDAMDRAIAKATGGK